MIPINVNQKEKYLKKKDMVDDNNINSNGNNDDRSNKKY